jgi:site-specific DNA-methyltransferase (cytosine-N4-specific)
MDAGETSVDRAAKEVKRRARQKVAEPEPPAPAGILGTVEQVLAGTHRAAVAGADCLGFLDSLPDGSVDLVFGSPPYERARLYLEDGDDPGIARDTDEWVAWMVGVYKAALRVCKGLVAFVVEGQTDDYAWTASPALLMTELRRAGITLRKPPAYKRVGIPGSGGNRTQHEEQGGGADWLRNDYEFIVCATNGGRLPWADGTACGGPCKYEPGGDPSHRTQDGSRVNGPVAYASAEDRNNVGPHRARRRAGRVYAPPERANPGNVIDCGAVGGGNMGDKLCHENEAPFPESLAEFFVRSFCRPGGVACDVFSGSGTTAAAALRWGRRFVGCDLRPSQIALTAKRIRVTRQQVKP